MDIQAKLDNYIAAFEQGLNKVGYLPIVSRHFSAPLRILFGKVEIVGGVTVAALVAMRALCHWDGEARQRGLDHAVSILLTYPLHGISNIFRGEIEHMHVFSLLFTLPYDWMGYRFAYLKEVPGRWEYRQING